MNIKHQLLCAKSAFLMVILFGVSCVPFAQFVPPIAPSLCAAEVVAIYQSHTDMILIGMVVIQAGIGESSEAWGAETPLPMWQLTTISWSTNAFQSGSQYSLWIEGRPTLVGLSGKVTAWTPSAETRFTSARVEPAGTGGSPRWR